MIQKRCFTAPAPPRERVAPTLLYMAGSQSFSPSWFFEDVTDSQTGTSSRVLRVRNMPVFRSGSFKDSMGDLTKWETLHIDQMAQSFGFLRDHQIFSDIPVRKGHGALFGDPMDGLVGYHDAVRTTDAVAPDGETYRYLLADFTIHDPAAQSAFISGAWPNRSSEVGSFESNDGTSYYPVYHGFAFVDIPAVQYLNLYGKDKKPNYSVLLEGEEMPNPVMFGAPPAGGAPASTINPDGSAAPSETAPSGGTQTHSAPGTTPDPVTGGSTRDENSGHDGASSPSQPNGPTSSGPFTFTIGGNQTQDFGAVQAYITGLDNEIGSLRQFRKDALEAGRRSYVAKLSTDKKILASQIEGLTKHALKLSDEDFTEWKKIYDEAPALPLFGQFAGNGSAGGTTSIETDPKRAEYKKFRDQVNWHRLGGTMLEKELREMEVFKKYQALGKELGEEAD